MGRDPLILDVDGWRFEVNVKDSWTQLAITTDERPETTNYVRITPQQAQRLREYLNDTLPSVIS